MPQTFEAETTCYVLMGASNLARGQYAISRALQKQGASTQIEFLYALGPGRGYCAKGGFLNVRYSPIHECGILSAVEGRAKSGNVRIAALLMDIGNDIMYGFTGDEIASRLKQMIDRLKKLNVRVWIAPIQVDMENDVDEKTFLLLRKVFFPNSSITYEQAGRAVKSINLEMQGLDGEQVSLIHGLNKFCGIDKIHYQLWSGDLVWTRIAQCLAFENTAAVKANKIDAALSLGYNLFQRCFHDILAVKGNRSDLF